MGIFWQSFIQDLKIISFLGQNTFSGWNARDKGLQNNCNNYMFFYTRACKGHTSGEWILLQSVTYMTQSPIFAKHFIKIFGAGKNKLFHAWHKQKLKSIPQGFVLSMLSQNWFFVYGQNTGDEFQKYWYLFRPKLKIDLFVRSLDFLYRPPIV